MSRNWNKILMGVSLLLVAAGGLAARAEARKEEARALEPGGQFVVDADAGSVEVVGTSRSGARIVIVSKDEEALAKFDVQVEETAGMVKLISRKKDKGGWFNWGTTSAPRFEVEVPRDTTIRIDTGGGHIEVRTIRGPLTLETSGGHISVEDVEGKVAATTSGGHISLGKIKGEAKVETSGGHIEAKDLDGPLECHTSGGHIDLDRVTGDIKAETSGGHVQIAGAGGRVDASTSGGGMQVSFARGNARGGVLQSSGGGIVVQLDPAVDLIIDAETSGGTVRSDIPIKITGEVSKGEMRGSIGRGGETLRIHTSAGSIQIGPPGAV